MTCSRRRATLATNLVGGDGTNKSIVHPIRWPGSWHRKNTPRLAKIVASSETTRSISPRRLSVFATRPAPLTFAGFGFKTSGKTRRRRSRSRSLGSLGHPERRSRMGRLEQDRHGDLGRYRRLGSRPQGVCRVVGQVVEERQGGRPRPAGSTTGHRRRRRSDLAPWSIWPASTRRDGLTKRQGLHRELPSSR